MTTVYTIGHSTHPISEFIEMLKLNNITQLIDIRTIPHSRHNPQFGQEYLMEYLDISKIKYIYMKELGGLRPKFSNSVNTGWRNESFRNYADYMQTPEFSKGIDRLIDYAKAETTVIMCAEALPWRCHRSLVGDALLIRGIEVINIMSLTKNTKHTLTSFAVVNGTNIIYPKETSNE